jgi:hypothetical protein
MYGSVPMIIPVLVNAVESVVPVPPALSGTRSCARPKSSSFTLNPLTITLDGFRSR